MDAFQTLTARCALLNQDNVDTDQVIPARFLTGTVKTGLGEHLFHDLRFLPDGQPNPQFPLNNPAYQGAKILVAGHNFGCGSSREHAPWALTDYGFRAIVAISFADIFKNNALKNGLLPVALPEAVIHTLFQQLAEQPQQSLTIDLESQTVTFGEDSYGFDIDPFRKQCLLAGVDDIGYTLKHSADIDAYEKKLANAH